MRRGEERLICFDPIRWSSVLNPPETGTDAQSSWPPPVSLAVTWQPTAARTRLVRLLSRVAYDGAPSYESPPRAPSIRMSQLHLALKIVPTARELFSEEGGLLSPRAQPRKSI
jgi:hypothetical protein